MAESALGGILPAYLQAQQVKEQHARTIAQETAAKFQQGLETQRLDLDKKKQAEQSQLERQQQGIDLLKNFSQMANQAQATRIKDEALQEKMRHDKLAENIAQGKLTLQEFGSAAAAKAKFTQQGYTSDDADTLVQALKDNAPAPIHIDLPDIMKANTFLKNSLGEQAKAGIGLKQAQTVKAQVGTQLDEFNLKFKEDMAPLLKDKQIKQNQLLEVQKNLDIAKTSAEEANARLKVEEIELTKARTASLNEKTEQSKVKDFWENKSRSEGGITFQDATKLGSAINTAQGSLARVTEAREKAETHLHTMQAYFSMQIPDAPPDDPAQQNSYFKYKALKDSAKVGLPDAQQAVEDLRAREADQKANVAKLRSLFSSHTSTTTDTGKPDPKATEAARKAAEAHATKTASEAKKLSTPKPAKAVPHLPTFAPKNKATGAKTDYSKMTDAQIKAEFAKKLLGK